jgi:hypothetical protein
MLQDSAATAAGATILRYGAREKRAAKPQHKQSNKLNAVEIEEAISALAEQPFDAQEFPFAFLEAFGNKPTTIKRLRTGASNKSDLGGVLQTNNIHIAVCPPGEVTKTLAALKASSATTKAKARFILAIDGGHRTIRNFTPKIPGLLCQQGMRSHASATIVLIAVKQT